MFEPAAGKAAEQGVRFGVDVVGFRLGVGFDPAVCLEQIEVAVVVEIDEADPEARIPTARLPQAWEGLPR